MSKYKKQHFIPISYLKAWCDPSTPKYHTPYVWVFSKDGKAVRKKAPENIFYETDMYTIEKADGHRNLILEKGLKELEQRFTAIRTHKLNPHRPLEDMDRIIICAFFAAMLARTRSYREHLREQWKTPLKVMEEMMEWAKTATQEQKESAASISALSDPPSLRNSLNYEQVKAISETPLQEMLLPMIRVSTPLLLKLDLSILSTTDVLGFITSDNPCVWFDSEAYKRPPFYRGPALMYEAIEITLPVSPRQCICLNRKGMKDYLAIPGLIVDEINRRTRFLAERFFVARKNQKKEIWFDPGVEPEDSWEKMQNKKISGGEKTEKSRP